MKDPGGSAEFYSRYNELDPTAMGRASGEPVGVSTALDGRKLDTPPRVLKKHDPEYPDFLLNHGSIRGLAQVEFTIDEKGEIKAPRVLESSHPAFVPPVMNALFKTTFAAGLIAGTRVPSLMRWQVRFDVMYGRWDDNIGRDAFNIPPKSGPRAPAEFQYDKPPRIGTLCEPVWPFDLMVANVEGEAEVGFVVDREGSVAAAKVTNASRPEFGAALVAAIESWRFAPPTLAGKPSMALLSWKQKFSPTSRELTADVGGKRIVKLLRTDAQKFVGLAALDRKPRAIYQVPPHYPRLLEEQGVAGVAEIEFVIDREGKVRMPRVVSAARDEFGWTAATAVQQWFFEPPLAQGKPVDVRVQMPFVFEPQRRKNQ